MDYDPPTGAYTQSIPAGTKALRETLGKHYGISRTEVIRNKSRCNNQTSEHCEARGIDYFTTDLIVGRQIFDWCVAHAAPFGIQSVIFNRRVWGFGVWKERAYDGPSPHTDHVHIGLTKWASVNLSHSQIQSTFQDEEDELTSEEKQMLKDIHEFVKDVRPGGRSDANLGAFWNIWLRFRPGSSETPNIGSFWNKLNEIANKL